MRARDDIVASRGAPAEHLTAVLRRDGVLGAAHVSEGEVESSRDTILSRIIRIGLKYDAGAGQVPRTLILMARAGNLGVAIPIRAGLDRRAAADGTESGQSCHMASMFSAQKRPGQLPKISVRAPEVRIWQDMESYQRLNIIWRMRT
ncbi:MAG: hypothetical protein WA702_09015 [Bradyrhizobium sp.]|uniref:hypothetical protein n=1 Tax=Bradyrhizobium sp. TaxID=376 RepID=UPI003C7CB8BD